jgi:hypothetical protein
MRLIIEYLDSVLESDFSCYVAMLVNYGVLDGWVRFKFDVVGGCDARAAGFTPRFWWATFDVVGCCHAHALARPGATGIYFERKPHFCTSHGLGFPRVRVSRDSRSDRKTSPHTPLF